MLNGKIISVEYKNTYYCYERFVSVQVILLIIWASTYDKTSVVYGVPMEILEYILDCCTLVKSEQSKVLSLEIEKSGEIQNVYIGLTLQRNIIEKDDLSCRFSTPWNEYYKVITSRYASGDVFLTLYDFDKRGIPYNRNPITYYKENIQATYYNFPNESKITHYKDGVKLENI